MAYCMARSLRLPEIVSAVFLLASVGCSAGIKAGGDTGSGGGGGSGSGSPGNGGSNGSGGSTSSGNGGASSSGSGGSGPCQTAMVKFLPKTPTVYLMVDRSGSMFPCLGSSDQTSPSAQTGQTAPNEKSESSGKTLKGCVESQAGQYVLETKKGSIPLTGQDVSAHVGHEVKVKGNWEKGASSAGATSTESSAMSKTFNVSNVDMVSENCKIKSKGTSGMGTGTGTGTGTGSSNQPQ